MKQALALPKLLLIAALGLLVLAPSASALDTTPDNPKQETGGKDGTPPQAPASDNAPLAGKAAWTALLGNTITGRNSDGQTLFEYYRTDGSVQHLDDDGVMNGTWTLQGDRICIKLADDDDETCYEIALEGHVASFTGDDGKPWHYDVLQGNPKGL